jgi:DNA-binding NtrC family response regulator
MAKKATILIVDREKILVDLLTRVLSSPELTVMGTTSTDEAARLVEIHGPEVVVIDPAIQNGIPLIAAIRSAPVKAKVVALTDSDEIRERVQKTGVEQTVDRNAGLDALVTAIRGSLPKELSVVGRDGRIGILIVDDEEDIRGLLSEFLGVRGYAVSIAGNGWDALTFVESDPSLQIVLLDVSMPVMGGMEALSHIMSRNPHPSVIMMTAVADREIARQAMKIGAFDYILKPFDFAAIEASITACLSYSEYQKQPWWKRLTGR